MDKERTMGEEKSAVQWGQIVTNAVSTLVAAVFLGAAWIVWNAATTMDQKIESANKELITSQDDLQATQRTLTGEFADLRSEIQALQVDLAQLRSSVSDISKNKKVSVPARKPVVLPKVKLEELKRKEVDRIQRQIESYKLRK